jgi:hypothetical protein
MSAPAEVVSDLCYASGLPRELVVRTAASPSDEADEAVAPWRLISVSGVLTRLRHPRRWGYENPLTGQPRKWISPTAMNRLPAGHTYYAPLSEQTGVETTGHRG